MHNFNDRTNKREKKMKNGLQSKMITSRIIIIRGYRVGRLTNGADLMTHNLITLQRLELISYRE
jgi:hypothetical protein